MNIQNRSIALFFLVLTNLVVCGQDLIPYHKGNLQGFCTTDKSLIVKPQYEKVTLFKKGYALVIKNNKLGMIDEKGEELIPCLYTDLHPVSEGLLMAKNEKLLYGYIDLNNKVVIPFQYEYASDFYRGIACVKMKNGNHYLIDKTGKKAAINPGWKEYKDVFVPGEVKLKVFYEAIPEPHLVKGVFIVGKKNGKGSKKFLSNGGKQIGTKGYDEIDLQYLEGNPLIRVVENKKAGFINMSGKEIVSPVYNSAFSDFFYGLAYNQNCIVDTSGKVVLDSVVIHYASDRFVRVKYNDSTMRYYDLKRRAFFPGVFVWGSSVSNGIAFAQTDDDREVSVNLLTGKKRELTEVQKKTEKFRGDDAFSTLWTKEKLGVHSRMGFRFLNDSTCFDKYYIVDINGKPTGAIVHSFNQFLNSMTDKNGNKKEELALTRVTPNDFDCVITDADTLIILNSTPVLRNEKNVISTDPINKKTLSADQSVVIDLNGNVRYEVNVDGAKAFDKKGGLINTFPCYTCDGEVKGLINHRISYDRELKMFLSPMGYISTDFKTAYFED
ncbi:MAG: WG repeat-containing protein [Bacteroidota bacterium]|nr:WG repeat-containing protein [Bacteroidota bacterium]